MSILYDEGQQAIATESRRVLDARVGKDRLLKLLEQVGEYDKPFWDTAVEQGWTALAIPEEHGGLGLGLVEQDLGRVRLLERQILQVHALDLKNGGVVLVGHGGLSKVHRAAGLATRKSR